MSKRKMQAPEQTMKLPRLFFEDHKSRALPTPDVLRTMSRQVEVRTNDQHLAELASDAGYYASFEGSDYTENRSVVDSARSTLRALQRAAIKETA